MPQLLFCTALAIQIYTIGWRKQDKGKISFSFFFNSQLQSGNFKETYFVHGHLHILLLDYTMVSLHGLQFKTISIFIPIFNCSHWIHELKQQGHSFSFNDRIFWFEHGQCGFCIWDNMISTLPVSDTIQYQELNQPKKKKKKKENIPCINNQC